MQHLIPRSEGRDDQLQQVKDRQVVSVSTFITCVSRGVLRLPTGRKPKDRDQPHSISDELYSHVLNLMLGKGLT